MKTFFAALCSLVLLSCASFGFTEYRAVTFSGVEYSGSSNGAVSLIVINNTYLIEHYGLIAAKNVHFYDVAMNETTGEVDVVSKTNGVVVNIITATINGTGNSVVTSLVQNLAGTARYITSSVYIFNDLAYPGSTYSVLKYNSSNALVSDSIIFTGGGDTIPIDSVVHGTCTTRSKVYLF